MISETQRIAHRSLCGTSNQRQRFGVCAHRLRPQNMLKVCNDLLGLHVLQVELKASGEDRCRQFLRVGGGQQEHRVGRRLLEGFQQGVEAVVRQHVHLVDQIDFVARVGWRVLHVF